MNEHPQAKQPRSTRAAEHTTDARAMAQRAKLDAHTQIQETTLPAAPAKPNKKKPSPRPLTPRRAALTLERAIGDYLLDHEGGNRSPKTIEWHRTALRLLRAFLEQERHLTLPTGSSPLAAHPHLLSSSGRC